MCICDSIFEYSPTNTCKEPNADLRSNTRRRTSVYYNSAYIYLRHGHQFTWTEVDITTSRETTEIIRPDLCEASMRGLSVLCVYEGIIIFINPYT